MPRFRPFQPITNPIAPRSLSLDAVRELAVEVIRPAHFFVAPSLRLEWKHVAAEETFWEVFRGRLLDPAHTRQRRSFEAWNVYQIGADGRSAEPLLSLKLDAEARQLHVVRGLESYVWEGYDAGGNVFLSRERRKWVRELVGTVRLERFSDRDDLADELISQLFHAVVGASRLPLSSVETPLPAFSFGGLFYCYRPNAGVADGPLQTWRDLVREGLSAPLNRLERAKLLETFLHAVPDQDLAAAWSILGQTSADLIALLRTLFNEVSLSPFTDLVHKTLAFLRVLESAGSLSGGEVADFLGSLLRQNGRHLTAYDLITFHYRGANYPDALLLDAVLKAYLALAERRPDLFRDEEGDSEGVRRTKRLRRRALRQAWLLRRQYEGLPVPDAPTSPGENNRVLPASHPRVPEEQILEPARRTKRLFDGDPLTDYLGERATDALRQSIADLRHPEELRELGTALYLDRPLGDAKAPAEPDGTLLLTSVAFSRSIAGQRLECLARNLPHFADAAFWEDRRRDLRTLAVPGLPLDAIGEPPRPATVALTDARRAAADFVFRRTTAHCIDDLLALFDFGPLSERFNIRYLTERRRVLLARKLAGPGLVIYDEELRPRLELQVNAEQGYESRAGMEYPADGLSVVRVGDVDLRASPEIVRPRD